MLNRVIEKLRRILSRKDSKYRAYLRESTDFCDIGEAGPLITDMFERVKDIPGWFNVDDCGHFFLVLSYQNAMGIGGDLLEIGSYHGRSTAIMARCLKTSEKIVVCDAFTSETDDVYANKPTPEKLRANVKGLSPGLSEDRVVIHKCLSNDLELDDGENFRFTHIDGGHSAEQAYQDLKKCGLHTQQNGIIVMDDYHNKDWLGVTEGTDRFLAENPGFSILADLNRHGALGRKLYLIKRE